MKSPLVLGVLAAVAFVSVLESQGQRSIPPPRTAPAPMVPTPGMRLVPTSTVSGLVVDDAGRPMPTTAIRLVGDRSVQTLLTDARGRFTYDNVVPGEYVLVARKYGFHDGAYGKRRAGGTPLPFSVAATQSMTNLKIELFRSGVITGAIFDEGSEPIPGARVLAVRRTFDDGEWRYTPAGTDTTDDRGQYRIFDLVPGEYIVVTPTLQLTSQDGTNETPPLLRGIDDDSAYPMMYFPSSRYFLRALPLALSSGEVRYATDFQWTSVPARTVSGRLQGDPRTIDSQIVRLVPTDLKGFAGTTEAAATVSAADGTFLFHRVPAGEYRLEAGTAFLPGADELASVQWARADIEVTDRDLNSLIVPMRSGHELSGSIEFASTADRAAGFQLSTVPLTLIPAAAGLSPMTRLRADGNGEFKRSNLIPGQYYLRVGVLPPGAFLKTISHGGKDALDRPINLADGDATSVRVVLTDRGTEINGSVRDGRMQAAAGAAVIVMPAGEENWTPNRSRYVRASTNGIYAVGGLPAGDYLIVAVDDAVAEGWQDARVLSQLRTLATRLTLRDAETRTIHMRLSQLRR